MYRADKPIFEHRKSLTQQLLQWVRRWWAVATLMALCGLVALVLALALVALVGGVNSGPLRKPGNPYEERARQPPGGSKYAPPSQ